MNGPARTILTSSNIRAAAHPPSAFVRTCVPRIMRNAFFFFPPPMCGLTIALCTVRVKRGIVVRWAYSRALPGWCVYVHQWRADLECRTIENNYLNSFVGIECYLYSAIRILRENDRYTRELFIWNVIIEIIKWNNNFDRIIREILIWNIYIYIWYIKYI